MFCSLRKCLLVAMLCTVAFAAAGFAQTPKPTPATKIDDDVIKVQSRLVVIPVSVTGPDGQPVMGLKAANFAVVEDGRAQAVEQVSDAEQTPLEIALLVDVSGSVNPLFKFEIDAAAQFLESVMKADDRATIFLIGDKPISFLTRQNSTEAAARIRTVQPSGKFTAFYDTVATAAKYLQKNAPQRSRKVILALTDGEDNWSDLTREAEKNTYRDIDINKLTPDMRNKLAARTDTAHTSAQSQILKDLQNADTVFYAINPAGDSYKLNRISTRAQKGMDRFANDTGGTAFLPRFVSTTTKDGMQNTSNTARNKETLAKIFDQLASELRAQYLLQYYSEADYPVNKYVTLKVDVQSSPIGKIKARQGYFVK